MPVDKVNIMIKYTIILLLIIYISCYCCIYNSYIIFSVADTLKLNPEYRSVDLPGTELSHAYVHVLGHDLFLNPFREYDDTHRVRTTTEEFIDSYSNWGQLYVPILDKFITVF